jgi:hypothetical protein
MAVLGRLAVRLSDAIAGGERPVRAESHHGTKAGGDRWDICDDAFWHRTLPGGGYLPPFVTLKI